ncbi:hypothetical protein [Streptomyces sp. ADI93-02]|uniref:hypothetical protein n=1 Tax=Streptomyces sp. ADI93-02 TaxID=1522757 RepID=UPI000F54E32F|nr:hypothetical protein [Streptomyces sp. ADI93-02]
MSPYVYDLVASWRKEIPTSMTSKGSTSNLARIDVPCVSLLPDRHGGEFRYDWIAGTNWSYGAPSPNPSVGHEPTEFRDYRWSQEAYAGDVVSEIGAKTAYRPESHQSDEWFKPIQRVYLNDAYRLPLRIGDRLILDVPAWGAGTTSVCPRTTPERPGNTARHRAICASDRAVCLVHAGTLGLEVPAGRGPICCSLSDTTCAPTQMRDCRVEFRTNT